MTQPTVFHIPVCPFCQRLEILLTLKGRRSDIAFSVVDVTRPRPEWLLAKTRGTTALPIMETADGRILKESLVIQQYLEDLYPERPVAQRDPYRRAVENMLTRLEGEFCNLGYTFVMNQLRAQRDALHEAMLAQYARLNDFLVEHSTSGPFLYYDYAKGAGNGALLPGRQRSSFTFEPDWRGRPWPPKDKYAHSATDAELGL